MRHDNGELLDTLRVYGRFGYIHHTVCCKLDLLGRKTLVKMLALNGNVLSKSGNRFGAVFYPVQNSAPLMLAYFLSSICSGLFSLLSCLCISIENRDAPKGKMSEFEN